MWERWPARKLPEMDIGGVSFFLDLRLYEFRDTEDFSNAIIIDELYETGEGFKACFDPKTRNLFTGDEAAYNQRKDLVIVNLPALEKMDPIGWKALCETWKDENPVQAAAVENVPVVIELKEKITNEQKYRLGMSHSKRPALLQKKRDRTSKGKRL